MPSSPDVLCCIEAASGQHITAGDELFPPLDLCPTLQGAHPLAANLRFPRPHLPQGFSSGLPGVPGYDNVVLSRYFNEHLPWAAAVAEELRQRGGDERLVFMTHVRLTPHAACCLLDASLRQHRAGSWWACLLHDSASPAYGCLLQSWVVSLFLDCPARIGVRCPNATAVASVKQAIQRGDITWHALPHNGQVRRRNTAGLATSGQWAVGSRPLCLLRC